MAGLDRSSTMFVAGHRGLVGSAILRALSRHGFRSVVTRSHEELDLLDQRAVHEFFAAQKIRYAMVAAAKVGGIQYNNSHQADFLYENVTIASNIIHAAHLHNVEKLLYLGSSCIYPRMAPQPIQEESLLSGPLEPTNEGYALAKIVGLKMCQKYKMQYGRNFISGMPTNLFGENDNFHPDRSHVIPGMMRRFHEAKVQGLPEVVIWGTGNPKREFLYVDDLAEALVVLMDSYNGMDTINIGTGEDCTISELASLMKEVTGYPGKITYDLSKPDGTPRKVLDIHKIRELGWSPKVPLKTGLSRAYAWALERGVFETR